MIQNVIKRDGSTQPFDEAKLNRWASYAARNGIEWSDLARETFIKLPDECSTEQIHTTMINVCLDKEDIIYSRFAARLLIATLRKNMIKHVGCSDKDSFKDIHKAMVLKGLWSIEYDEALEDIYNDLYPYKFEYWQIKQWMDKYSAKVDDVPVETPHMGLLALAKGTFDEPNKIRTYAKNLVEGSINLPTPVLNGIRNGDYDSISCCVISGGDSVDSIGVADHIAYKMTAKKAGIGIEVTTRSKGAPVKGGRVKHLGKSPIYHAIDKSVKMFTQISRGGSATVTYNCIDPEIESLLLLKTQKIDEKQRIDKLDYSFAYCDAFVEAVVTNADWYLFDYFLHPKAHALMYDSKSTLEDFQKYSQSYSGVKSIKAREILKSFLTSRQETGRVYCINLSRANSHTPFTDTIRLSNLCVAPNTLLRTDKGDIPIHSLEDEYVNIWNGEDWSNVKVVKTGSNQQLLNVSVCIYIDGKYTEDSTLTCTPYHKWYLENGDEVRSFQLNRGEWLESWDTPEGQVVTSFIKELSSAENDDTYCVTEPLRHKAVFNGILTGQCQEIMLPTKPYTGMHDLYANGNSSVGETAFCSLGAINPIKITTIDKYQEVADILVEAINIYIDKAPMMTDSMKADIMNRRSIGVGITGLAGWLYKQNLDYDMEIRTKNTVAELAEMHYYCLLKASQNLYTGTSPEGIDLNWLPIDTKVNDWYTPKLDWESLRGKPRVNSVLVAHMPTESSAVFSNATNGLYPVRQKVINKQSRYGNIQYIAPKGTYKLAWDIANNHLADVYSVIQDFTDQAISADYYVDFTKYEGGKVGLKQLMQEWVYQSRKGNKTMYYVNSNDDNGGMFSNDDGCSSCKL